MARTRSPHPGVVLRPARPEKRERAHIRYREPETGKSRTEAVPAELEGDQVKLMRWLRRKSAELMVRKARSTAPPGKTLPTDALVEKFFRERHRLAESTKVQYRYSTNKFVAFAGSKAIGQKLLRDWRAELDRPGAAAESVNRDLRHVAAVLNYLRESGDLIISAEAIATGLKRLESDAEKKTPLTLAEIRRLLLTVRDPWTIPAAYPDFVQAVLLGGMRRSECVQLEPEMVNLAMDRLELPARITKTRKPRWVDLGVSPSLRRVFADFHGWGLTKQNVRELREWLHPDLTFQRMRVTCGTYLTCAPGIYGGASAYMSAARLGHSVAIAEKHYVGVVQVDPAAKTLEAAMGIDNLLTSGQ